MAEPRVISARQIIYRIPPNDQHIPEFTAPRQICKNYTSAIGRNLDPFPSARIRTIVRVTPSEVSLPHRTKLLINFGVKLCWAHNHIGLNLAASCNGLRACSCCTLQTGKTPAQRQQWSIVASVCLVCQDCEAC